VKGTVFKVGHLSVPGVTAQDQLINQPESVMDFVTATSVKWFSSIHRAQYVLYVICREMETSSESNLCALPTDVNYCLSRGGGSLNVQHSEM